MEDGMEEKKESRKRDGKKGRIKKKEIKNGERRIDRGIE